LFKMEGSMLATNTNPSAYSQSIILSNSTDSNSYMSSIKDTNYAGDESFQLSDNKFGNNLVKLIFLLCFISAYYSSDSVSSYENKLNSTVSIAPEVYKSSQEFWWNQKHYVEVYKLESTNQGRSASAYMTVLMHYAVRSGDVKFLNTFFEKLNRTQLTSWSLIALLRSTSVYKQDIVLWKDFYIFTRELVEKSGLNPKRELYGLDRGLSL
jgi:hypothetical protein